MKRSISHLFGPRIGALLFAILMFTASAMTSAAVYVSVDFAPPFLPAYEQPLIPGPGYIWTPGYWAWGPDEYYWVPGTWVFAPFVGALWTPGYWGRGDSSYVWYSGYWGRHVGFYGGINYGCGYTGVGYQGGYWDGGSLRYNRAVNNVNITNITNTYNTTVVNNTSVTHVSYNGGPGGVIAQPTAQDRIATRETHTPMLPVQAGHELAASSNRALLASVNNGRPAVAATPLPVRFAIGRVPARSFSQQAAVRPGAWSASNNAVGPNPRVNYDQRVERRNAPVNASASQFQAVPRPQVPVRAPSEMHPQGLPQAQIHPQGPPHEVRQQYEAQRRPPGPPQMQVRPQGAPQEGRPQYEAQMRPQGLPQAQIHPQGPPHEGRQQYEAQMQVRPQGAPQGGRPQYEARVHHGGPNDRPIER